MMSTVRYLSSVLLAFCNLWMMSGPAYSQERSALRMDETDSTITIWNQDRKVLVYNKVSPPVPEGIDPIYARSGFLHPVLTPRGQTITAAFPVDHAHQHGIFAAWVNATYRGQQVDFWNLAKREARIVHERVVRVDSESKKPSFEVDLLHQVTGASSVENVLRERWKVTAIPNEQANVFDIELKQEALQSEPLVINEYHYGGMAVRGPVAWLQPNDSAAKNGKIATEPSSMQNSRGDDRIQGNHAHARWVSLSGQLGGHACSITVFDDPKNFRAPQASRLHPTKPYFCFAPCVDGQFVIDRDHPYQARYRFVVTDAAPDPKWLDEQWKAWSEQ